MYYLTDIDLLKNLISRYFYKVWWKIMDFKIRIEQRRRDFTPSDQKIAKYVLDNMDKVLSSNTNKLAELTGTSQSAIIRFVKKIGYKGFFDFKLDIAKSFDDVGGELKDDLISKNDEIGNIIKKSKSYVLSATEKTYALFDEENIRRSINLINQADKVYLAGVGSSGLVCEDFLYKLQRSGKNVSYERDAHFNLSAITNIKKDDLLICISYAGKTKEIITAAKYASYCNTKVISISKSQKSELANYSDILILIPEIEGEIRLGAVSSRFFSLMVTDILYYGYVASNMDEVLSKLKISKNLTNNLK